MQFVYDVSIVLSRHVSLFAWRVLCHCCRDNTHPDILFFGLLKCH